MNFCITKQNPVLKLMYNTEAAEQYHSYAQRHLFYGKMWSPERAKLENLLCRSDWNEKILRIRNKRAELRARRNKGRYHGDNDNIIESDE